MLFRWRVELGFGRGKSVKLASVRIADGQTAAVVLHDLLLPPEGMAARQIAASDPIESPVVDAAGVPGGNRPFR